MRAFGLDLLAGLAFVPRAELGAPEDMLPAAELQQALLRRISPEDIIPYVGYGVVIVIAALAIGWAFGEFVLNADRRAALRSLERSMAAGGIDVPVLEKLAEDPELLKQFLSKVRHKDPDKARVYAIIASEVIEKRKAARAR